MKLVLIYINPNGFDKQSKILAKIQIDNSLELSWKKKNIIFLSNVEFKYRGVKAVFNNGFCDWQPINSKLTAIVSHQWGNDLYWVHDLDSFQQVPISEKDVDISHWDMALCDYGRLAKWCGASIFFKKSALDIFEKAKELMERKRIIDEGALTSVTYWDNKIYNRIKKMNISYNFLPYNLGSCYRIADKPIKVVHFDPFEGKRQLKIKSMLDYYKGNNEIKTNLLESRLLKIFDKYHL
jgi:hypothetical protein